MRVQIYSITNRNKHAPFSVETDVGREPGTAPMTDAVSMIGSTTNLLA